MRRPLVSICGDPGGARALVPVLRRLRDDEQVAPVNYAYHEALEILEARGVAVRPMPPDSDAATVRAILATEHPVGVLTGTSCNGRDLEKLFIAGAFELGIPSLALLDFWSGYVCRFAAADGTLGYLPDTVAVMDARAQRELAAAGVPDDRIVVTGQPAFDELTEVRQQFTAAHREEVRRSLGVAPADLLIGFVSQPLGELYRTTQGDARFLGYDEREVLGLVIDAVASLREVAARPVRLVIRCHPRESSSSFSSFENAWTRVARADNDARAVAMSCDLVVGMNSALLLEACFLGCPVLSVQPGLRGRDALPSNASGASVAVYTREGVAPALRTLLLDDLWQQRHRARLADFRPTPGATQRVVERVYAAVACHRGMSGIPS